MRFQGQAPTSRLRKVLWCNCGRWAALLVLALEALAGAVGAAGQPESNFSGGTAPLFPVTAFTLTNGLRLLVSEDHHSPIVAVQVWYSVGSADEPAGRRGFAHLFEHMMFRGTDRLGPSDHMDLIRRVGGECNAFTTFDATCYEETLPANQLELAFWLEAERMAFLTVDKAGLDTERSVVEEELLLGAKQPYGDLLEKGLPVVFGNSPYAHSPIGTIRDLRAATAPDVHAWWARWYVPNRAVLVVVGDIQAQRVKQLCDRYFGWIPAGPELTPATALIHPFEKAERAVLELENAPAPAAAMIWRTASTGNADAPVLQLVATILGGGESSRLYRRLVNDDRTAVAAMAAEFGLRQAGVFAAGAALSPVGHDIERALREVQGEAGRLWSNGVTEVELEKARNGAVNDLVLSAETVHGKARLIGTAAVVGAGVDELNGRLARLRETRVADLLRVIRTYLDPSHALTVIIPGASILGQFTKLLSGGRKQVENPPAAAGPSTILRGRPGVVRPEDLPARPPLDEHLPSIPDLNAVENRLANGLRVLVSPNSDTPVVHVIVALPFGSWAEDKPGTASLTLQTISKCTEIHDEESLAEELERHGIEVAGSANHDESTIEMTCLADEAERGVGLLAEIVRRPAFAGDSLKTAVSQTITSLSIAGNDPSSVADREFRRIIFAGHPYGRRVTGEQADVSKIRREDMLGFWNQISHPDRATLVFAGALDRQRALGLADRFFSGWKVSEAPDRPMAEYSWKKPAALDLVVVDWPGAAQSEIRIGTIGFRRDDPARPLGSLVNSYFGSSYSSRLMKTVRIEQGSTYHVHGGFEAQRFAGLFQVSTSTRTESTAETLHTVLRQIRRLVEELPSPEELSLHRQYLLGSAAAHLETSGQVAGQLIENSMNSLPLDYVRRKLSAIRAADAEQCLALARRWVDPDRLSIVVVGDAARITNELRAIAPVTVSRRLSENPSELHRSFSNEK